MLKKSIYLFLVSYLFVGVSSAELIKENIEYRQGDAVLEGYLVYDDAYQGKRPGVVVIHDWMGFGEYGNTRAEMLAQMGYVALAGDIYGKGIRPQNSDEAGEQAGKFKADRALLRERVNAALDALKASEMVDPARTAAIGYCFGGTTVLELARSGADVAGVVSFHGGLASGDIENADIKAKLLVLHGADDPHVPPAEVAAFSDEMNQAGADWQMVHYSGAVHSFTKKSAGDDPSTGSAYNEKADRRSWEAMKSFFAEIFNK